MHMQTEQTVRKRQKIETINRRNGEVGRESDQSEDVEIFKFNLF